MKLWIIKDSYLGIRVSFPEEIRCFLVCWICNRTHVKIIVLLKLERTADRITSTSPHTHSKRAQIKSHTPAWCTHTNNHCVLWQKLLICTPPTVQFNRTLYVLYWVYISSSASEIHYCQNMCCSGWSMHVFIILSE